MENSLVLIGSSSFEIMSKFNLETKLEQSKHLKLVLVTLLYLCILIEHLYFCWF